MLALMAIRDWPSDERPREKLLEKGAAALSDAELLAILLRTGTPGHSALDLARDVLQQLQFAAQAHRRGPRALLRRARPRTRPLRRIAGRRRNLPAAAVGVHARRARRSRAPRPPAIS